MSSAEPQPAPRPGHPRAYAIGAAAAVVALAVGGTLISRPDLTRPEVREAPRTAVDAWVARAEDPSRGAAPLGSRVSEPPADAVWVAPGGAGDGTKDAPYGSVGEALAATGSGATIVLRAGSYHEEIGVFDTPEKPRRDVTIQAAPGEEVWLDGSREAKVVREGGRSVVHWQDAAKWNDWQSFDDRDETGDLAVVGGQNPVAADPTEVWVDGERLWQVERAPKAGQFAVERSGRRDARTETDALIVLGEDPGDATVRVSALTQALTATSPGLRLEGIGVRGYATPVNWMGTVYLAGEGSQVRDMLFSDLPAISLFLSGATDALVEHVTVVDSGLQGISAVHTDGATFRGNVVRGANHQLFNPAPIAGGMKVGQMRDFTIEDSSILGTREATGLWVDESGVDFTIARNLVADSGRNGVQIEISGRGLVTGNTIARSAESGVQVYGSEDVAVTHNLVAGSGRRGTGAASVAVLQDERRASEGGMGVDTRGEATDLTWVTRDVRIAGNVLALPDPAAGAQLLAKDHTGRMSADDMGLTIGNNLLMGSVPTSTGATGVPTLVWRSGEDEVLVTAEEAAARLGSAWRANVAVPADADPAGADEAIDDATRRIAPPVEEAAADALGVDAGTDLLGPPVPGRR